MLQTFEKVEILVLLGLPKAIELKNICGTQEYLWLGLLMIKK